MFLINQFFNIISKYHIKIYKLISRDLVESEANNN